MDSDLAKPARSSSSRRRSGSARRRLVILALALSGTLLVSGTLAVWLVFRANQINSELRSAQMLIPKLRAELASQDDGAPKTLAKLLGHTGKAREAVKDPVWAIASVLPVLGPNFSAVRELTLGVDEIALGTAKPLITVAGSLNWSELARKEGKFDLAPLAAASPAILSAANTLELTYQRLRAIDSSTLVSQVGVPLTETTKQIGDLNLTLSTVADTAALLPSMLGTNEPRRYLILVQNNAEVRATGGLPGALAVIRVDDGSIELVAQSSGSAMGKSKPPVVVDDEQTAIYSSRLGTFIGDVNLTPDFPTAARTAKMMWEARYGGPIDGVVAIDPVVLAHLLDASGPLRINSAGTPAGMPTELTSENVVRTLLSDVYQALDTNAAQDAYFAAASSEVFKALSSGSVSGPALMSSLSKSYEENRVHLWSAHSQDQKILEAIPLGGSISGPSMGGAAFGVYFNDGTGAKMDYFVRRTVQLEEVCSRDGYSEYKVKIALTNTAPSDAATAFPTAVTGDGRFGTPRGSIQTNIVAYGPTLAHIDKTLHNGAKVSFGSHLHKSRPVGVHTVRLSPGETSNVEMTFVKVVQDATPSLEVTPTVEAAKDVLLPTVTARCAS